MDISQKGGGLLVAAFIIAVIIIIGIILFGGSLEEASEDTDTPDGVTEETAELPTEEQLENPPAGGDLYQYEGTLADVTESADVRGINTAGEATGTAQARFVDGAYELFVTFDGLPEPQGTDFYEGWIVRRGDDFDVVSTGVLEVVDGVYTNTYTSETDLTDHTFYVLTIEPDDGDPAPADHIVEGEMAAL